MNEDKLVIFDCDGTLTNSRAAIIAAMYEAFTQEGLTPPTPQDIRQIVGLSLVAALSRLLPRADQDVIYRLADHYEAASLKQAHTIGKTVPLFDGARAALFELHKQGYQLAVATGMGRRGLEALLEEHMIFDLFSVLKTANDGPSKPNPQILRDAMLETGIDSKNTVMVGDTSYDMEAAKRANIHGIGVDWGNHDVDVLLASGAGKIVSDFDMLTQYIQGYFAE